MFFHQQQSPILGLWEGGSSGQYLFWSQLTNFRAIAPQQKINSLDDIMMGSGFGKIQIKFADTPKRVTNDGNVHNGQ